jgi:hypothetical protein
LKRIAPLAGADDMRMHGRRFGTQHYMVDVVPENILT